MTALADQTPLVRLRGVGMTYPGPPPVPALRPSDVVINHGDYIAVMGRSGSGKSTLLNILGLIDRPTSGTYLFEGIDVGSMPDAERTALRAHRIGLVFQAFHLLPHRTALENVGLGLLYRGIRAAERLRSARAALDRVGLSHRVSALPTRLSGGERQRLAIARAMVAEPSLLLCDEPTGNLDSATADTVMDIIDDLNRDGLAVVLISHDRDVAARARRTMAMSDGVLRDDLTVQRR